MRAWRGLGVRGRLEIGEHVALGDPAAGAGGGNLRDVDALFADEPSHGGRERLGWRSRRLAGACRRWREPAASVLLAAARRAGDCRFFAARLPRAAAESAGSMVATVAPTATVSPSSTAIRSTPEPAAGTSLVALSVSSSKRGSPALTSEPSALCQRERIPSEIDSPTDGTVTGTERHG